MLKFVLRSIIRKKHISWAMIITVAAFIATQVVLSTVSQSMLITIRTEREEVYGSFSYIYYENQPEDTDGDKSIENVLSNDQGHYESGKMTVVDQYYDSVSQNIFNIGYVDQSAIEQGSIKLVSGSFPIKDNEVAVTESVAEALNITGDKSPILIHDREYIISGIIGNYGRLWPVGKRQLQSGLVRVDIFLPASQLDTSSIQANIYLIKSNSDISGEIAASENCFSNVNNMKTSEDDMFRLPTWIYIISFLVCLFLLISVTSVSISHLRKKYELVFLQGSTQKQVFMLFNLELLIYTVIGSLLGATVGAGISFGLLRLISAKLGKEIEYFNNYKVIFIALIALIILTILIGNIFLLFDINKKKAYFHVREKAHQTNLIRLSFLELGSSLYIVLFIVGILASSAVFLICIDQYSQRFKQQSKYEAVNGMMPMDFDYEIWLPDINTSPAKDGDIAIVNSYESSGIDQDGIDALNDIPGIAKVSAYKEENKIVFMLPDDSFDQYLDVSDMFLDDSYSMIYWESIALRKIDLADNKPVETKLLSYPEDELILFEPFVLEGKIDTEKINLGEEIILLVPAVRYEEVPMDNGILRSDLYYVSKDSEGAINDTLFHAGDKIDISTLNVCRDINGGVNASEIDEFIAKEDHTVRIGAIIRDCIGWFEKETVYGNTYRLLTSNTGIEKMVPDLTYNRARIWTDTGSDDGVTAQINEIGSKYPRMVIYNMGGELKNYKELNLMVKVLSGVLSFITIVIGLIVCCIQTVSKSKINRNKYYLYYLNGIYKSELFWALFIQFLLVFAVAVSIAIIIACLIKNSLDYSFSFALIVELIIFATAIVAMNIFINLRTAGAIDNA